MSKGLGSVLNIGLDKRHIALLHTRGWLRPRSEVLGESALSEEAFSSPEAVAEKLHNMLGEAHCSRMPVRIVLADGWVRRWMVTPPQNARRFSDCVAAAAARFHALFGEDLSHWQLAADWDCRRPFLACALPLPLANALRQVAHEHKLALLEVAPQFVVAWNRWRAHIKENAWFGVIHERVLTVAAPSRHGLDAVREVSLPDSALQEQARLPQIVSREALRMNVAMPTEIHLCGQIPAHWVMHEMDHLTFLRLDRPRVDDALPFTAGLSLAATGMAA